MVSAHQDLGEFHLSYSTATQARPLLDSGQIIVNSFLVLRRGFLVLLVISVLPWLPIIALAAAFPHTSAVWVGGLVLWTVTASALTRAAFRIHHELPVQIIPVFRSGFKGLIPLFICAIAATLAIYFGTILIVPAVYLMGMWCMIVPAIAIENRGFGCFPRSSELTQYYRWALGLFWVLFSIAAMVLCSIPMFLGLGITVGMEEVIGTSGLGSSIGGLSIIILWSSTWNILSACLTAMMYTRLVEIEEGMGAMNAAAVFE